MLSKKIAIGGFFLFSAVLFMFPDASRVGNICYPESLNPMESPFPMYIEGCNMWIRTNPTYPIFIPLIAIGILILTLGLKNNQPTSMKKVV
jgi:hypothetical protein